ncbi:pectinesterase family protein [Opitutus sp. ER46]|uniref:pectinesterase family protein n=1 Tax=Opitutus sp. ER46 TaxID=2161864 RepID=UPI001304B04C|nr:pectinesterase family protein [Opitutus sp. ER46]
MTPIPPGSGQFRRVAGWAALMLASMLSASAQLSWSAFDETTTTTLSSQPDGTTTVTVPAGKRVTLFATNFVPVDFTARPTGEVYATITFKASGGLSTIGSGTRAIGFGLYNTNGTATFADDNGYFTWLNGRATGSLIELRRRNGDGTSTSLLNPSGTAFNSLGTGTKTFTSGTLSDGNSYSIQLHLMGRNPGVSLGNTSSSTTGAGVWVSGDGLSQTAYTNPDNPPATQVFNQVGFMFYNSTAADVTLTVESLTGLTAVNPPAVAVQPVAISVNPGQTGTLSVTATGTAPLAYQWKKDGTAISGATAASYTFDNATAAHAGSYAVTITNSYGSVASNAATVTVTTTPIPATIIRDPAAVTVTAGAPATFTVAAYGSSPVAYQWKKDGVAIAGATNPTYAIEVTTGTDAGAYTVTVSNTAGSATSRAATLTVNTKPVITTDPASVTTTLGQSVTFTVAASGSPAPTIQWQKNGVNLPGATAATLTIDNVSLANTGVYTARVANSVGAVTSAGALLAIPSPLQATGVWPAKGASGINPDTPLRITFDAEPKVGNFGKIQIHRATDGAVVDTLDLGVTPYTRLIGTQSVPYIFYPIIVTGNTAAIYPHAGVLEYGQSYYVTIDRGALLDATGATFNGISDSATWSFTTKISGPVAGATELTVAADGSADFTTVQGAIDFVPRTNNQRVVITVKTGTYTEMNHVGKPFITVRGEDRDGTVIQYADNNNFNTLTGNNRCMFSVDASDFTLETITLHNTTPKGGSQAEAFRGNGRRIVLNRVNLLSFQDTLLINGTNCSAFITDSYIEGDVDYMWGSGAVYFQRCEIKSLSPGYLAQVRNGLGQFGHIYVDCRLTGTAAAAGSYLARIDPTPGNFPYSQVVFLNCAMGSQILPVGWKLDNASNSATVQFGEYQSTDLNGATLDVTKRLAASRQLTESEATLLRNPAYVLGWEPAIAATIEHGPVAQSVHAGDNARFTVVANGAPQPVLQWYKDGVALAGATAATLVVPNAQPTDAGLYTVKASNAGGTVTSAAAALTFTAGKYAGIYQGKVGTKGTLALCVRDDGSAVMLASDADSFGTVVAREGSVDAAGKIQITGHNGNYVALTATIDEAGKVSGTIGYAPESGGVAPAVLLSTTMSATRAAGTGAAAALAGHYQLGAVGSANSANVIVAADGTAMVVAQVGNTASAGSGTVTSSGQLSVTITGGPTVTATLVAGSASGTITPAAGSAITVAGAIDAKAEVNRFREVSVRCKVDAGQIGIVGFAIAGDTPEDVLIRAVGPSLSYFGLKSVLPNPRIDVYSGSTLIASNVGWTTTSPVDIALATAQAGAFPLRATSADSALRLTLAPGPYTAIMTSASGTGSGIGLMEVYEVTGGAAGQRLTNLSARANIGVGEDTFTTGFVVSGSQPKRMLIRAVGPALAVFGVQNPAAKPVITLFQGSTVVAQNAGWTKGDVVGVRAATREVGTFPFAEDSSDSAMVIHLAPGLYTIQVTSADGGSGTALMEIYELP